MNTLSRLNTWAQKAPMCSCGRGNITYICKEEYCKSRRNSTKPAQVFYCLDCNHDGLHPHNVVQLETEFNTFMQLSSDVKEDIEQLYDDVKNLMQTWSPIVKHLEKMKKSPTITYKVSELEKLFNDVTDDQTKIEEYFND